MYSVKENLTYLGYLQYLCLFFLTYQWPSLLEHPTHRYYEPLDAGWHWGLIRGITATQSLHDMLQLSVLLDILSDVQCPHPALTV
nr:hypothetical protein CFP56_22008 [Quercus suber]